MFHGESLLAVVHLLHRDAGDLDPGAHADGGGASDVEQRRGTEPAAGTLYEPERET